MGDLVFHRTVGAIGGVVTAVAILTASLAGRRSLIEEMASQAAPIVCLLKTHRAAPAKGLVVAVVTIGSTILA